MGMTLLERRELQKNVYFTEYSHMTQLGYWFPLNISNAVYVLCEIILV